jgi:hypothetical protein
VYQVEDAQMHFLQLKTHYKSESWAIFVNLVKAFDTANHELLFKILKNYGAPKKLVAVIRKMYQDRTAVTFRTGKEKREIPYDIGVKQGDNMAPVLFTSLMNAFAKTLSKKWKLKKRNINGSHRQNQVETSKVDKLVRVLRQPAHNLIYFTF